ncbi:Gryzun, putative trafficking through golgi-domain-containing protein [Coniochaeta sp. 2T2.1]|nr:Gryzun, putative trafficking through golgi-domain-containing protein [Coniochaeta sp. 2T2.1]
MDDYPRASLDHNVPLLVTLGIPSDESPYNPALEPTLKDQATLVRSEEAPLESDQAQALLGYILDRDASDLPWNGLQDALSKYKFRVRTAARTLLLPPRRARLPDGIEPPQSPAVLHSPFSPLSPVSSLYPDGLVDTRWLRKHQELVPSVLLTFYSLTSDLTQATLRDNRIKSDINAIKNALIQSGYKTRLAVVVLGDNTRPSGDGTQDRLENIRKLCGIDTKSFFFVPPQETQEGLERIVENTLTTLYSHATEYYRDLGRHARKKRSRGVAPQPTVPPTTGTSRSLSLQDWNVRYDFKSAIFAEYRQEMDAAWRSFEQAYENLLSSEVVELIPSWSPRWDEARLLADIIAIRSLRCLLWNGQTTAAVRRWQLHRDRISDLVDSRGSGTNNYGWEAWEARWATVMANLLERVKLPDLAPVTLALYAQPEKAAMGDRLRPWDLLHHPGYWYHIAATHLYRRRSFALVIPDDDRRPPGSSPASKVAHTAFAYDTYMCPEPHQEYPLPGFKGVNHPQLIIDSLMKARSEFQKRQQLRMAAELTLECGREYTVVQDWQNVLLLLEPLWRDMSFRTEGWLDVAEDLSWTLRNAASNVGRPDLVLTVDWELLNRGFTKRRNWHYDIYKSLEGIDLESKPTVKIHDGNVLSFLSTSFVFKNEEGKAGQSVQAQLSITSNAHQGSAPIAVNRLQVDFAGSIRTLVLEHKNGASDVQQRHRYVTLSQVSLEERTSNPAGDDAPPSPEGHSSTASLQGDVDMTLAPGVTLVFAMDIPLREPGEANAASTRFVVNHDTFDIEYVARFQDSTAADTWYTSASSKRILSRGNTHSIHILPRPPKMEIKQLAVPDEFYTNESIDLRFEITNAEEESASTKLDVILRGEDLSPSVLQIEGQDGSHAAEAGEEESVIQGVAFGTIENGKSKTVTLRIDPYATSTQFELTLQATYHLETDTATSIIQTAIFQVSVVNPFEANYELLPRLHPDPWPTLFVYEGHDDPDTAVKIPKGLSQAWCLVTRYASFAAAGLLVKDIDINIRAPPTVRCLTTKNHNIPDDGREVHPKTIEEASFDLVAQKLSLDDRSPASLDVSFTIKWTRLSDAAGPVNTTVLPVPRLNIFGIEPRVLGSVSYVKDMVVLEITIENASNHFLTFGLTMEPSEEFAFSGSKQTTLHLLPVSRRSVAYRMLPLVRGEFVRPALVVRDKYFQKVLRVIPTEGMKMDKEGFLVWVPPEEEDDDGYDGRE